MRRGGGKGRDEGRGDMREVVGGLDLEICPETPEFLVTPLRPALITGYIFCCNFCIHFNDYCQKNMLTSTGPIFAKFSGLVELYGSR